MINTFKSANEACVIRRKTGKSELYIGLSTWGKELAATINPPFLTFLFFPQLYNRDDKK